MTETRDLFIRAREVANMTGLSLTSVYMMAKTDPGFPKPIRVGVRMNVWSRNRVHDWIEARVAASEAAAAADESARAGEAISFVGRKIEA